MNLTDMEFNACEAALAAVGEYVAGVGMAKGLEAYSREEALKLVATAYIAVRDDYQAQMASEGGVLF